MRTTLRRAVVWRMCKFCSGGNQRDLARKKADKKQAGKGKAASEQEGNKGLSLEERKRRDADRMREKQAQKEAQKAAKEGQGSSKS